MRTSPVWMLLAVWTMLYLAVGFELGATQGSEAFVYWTRVWAIMGLAVAPAVFLLGWRVGARDPRVTAGLVALASVLLAVFTIYATIFRAGQEGQSASPLPLSGALVFAALAVFTLTALVEVGGWSAVGRLLATIAVVGVLAMVIMPNFIHTTCHGQMTACKSNLKNIGTALEMYATDNAGRFPLSLDRLAPSYLRTLPTCPTAGLETYSVRYASSARPDTFSVCCSGNTHYETTGSPDLPMYTSTDGLIERLENPLTRETSPYLHAVKVGDAFLWVQALFIVMGIMLAFEPKWRAVALGLVGFAIIPWSVLVAHITAPIDGYNDCAQALGRYLHSIRVYRAEHPKATTPQPEDLAKLGLALTCPSSGASYRLSTGADGTVTVYCDGDQHQDVGCPRDYPRFTESDRRVHRVP